MSSFDAAKLFRERLRSLREAKGLTQGQLEELIGRPSPNYISRVETGRIETPPFEALAAIARALDVSMNDLFFFEGIDDSAKQLRAKILRLAETEDVKTLRKYYRLLLAATEK